jgi:demethylmenaquinone methyltransferase/2-methoxy-6-polyprenyl-1,4-benzoquinol methylase
VPAALPSEIRPGSGAMFDRIAARYDVVNRVLSLGLDRLWRRRAVKALAASRRVLDLATGTADLALALALARSDREVVATDPSEEMLRVARRKIEAASLNDRVHAQAGEAERIAQADRSFDGVSIAFGIRNVPDRDGALAEMARVTRDGGRIVILELTEPEGFLAPLLRFHVHHLVPRLGALLSGAAEYRYLERSIARFPSAREFACHMEAAGLRLITVRPLSFGVAHLFVAEPARPPATEVAG